jgi:beta-N-acetylhexosaminidase
VSTAVLIIVLLMTISSPVAPVFAHPLQQADPSVLASQMLAKMTPEEEVGQLFLITFQGSSSDTAILKDLIGKYHIGGVVLKSENDNFVGSTETLAKAYALTTGIQQLEWDASQTTQTDPYTNEQFTPQYIPLFISISQEGDLSPYDQIINGMTPLPNEMAIGATWDTSLAKRVGSVLGNELNALGFNFLLGPSLDVLEVLQTEAGKDLGTRTFGGDPFWVGELGAAYIQGVHEGSSNRMAVIAKYFPGRGGSDRPPDEEVATVRKSLEQLKQIELAPFFAVTGNAADTTMTTDGLLVSHIRYQGFQGNIRATTRPVSFDRDAMDQLFSLDAFSSWRANGGVVVSDDLGSQAVRRFYDPTGQTFDARQVARNAFLAGNDLLYVNNFIATGDPDQYTTIIKTLEFFTQKYQEDPAFMQRVDESVQRILTLKYKIYQNQFTLENVLPGEEGLTSIGTSSQVSFDVERNALTLVSPDINQLPDVLPEPPSTGERLLFITDVVTGKQCSTCEEQTSLSVNSLMNAVDRLYGTQAGGQIYRNYMSAYSFADLNYLLNSPEEPPMLEEELSLSNWVIFSMLSTDSSREVSSALKRLLSERPDLLKDKKVIVFEFNAPIYLDATDISKLTAYYALYSKIPQAIDVAARVLFQEIAPMGNLPVSVPAIGYDLISVTAPNPDQIIPLFLDQPTETTPTSSPIEPDVTPFPTPVPKFKVGDTLPIRTGVIFDNNNNPVPDGTVVTFTITVGGETGTVQQVNTVTQDGIARTSYRIASQGIMEIKASSDPALLSEILTLDVTSDTVAVITIIAPTPIVTETIGEVASPTPTATEAPVNEETKNPGISDWLLSMLVIWAVGGCVFVLGRRYVSLHWGLRWGLCSILGGLLFYTILIIFIPVSLKWSDPFGRVGLFFVLLLGCGLGFGVGYIWRNRFLQTITRKQEK